MDEVSKAKINAALRASMEASDKKDLKKIKKLTLAEIEQRVTDMTLTIGELKAFLFFIKNLGSEVEL